MSSGYVAEPDPKVLLRRAFEIAADAEADDAVIHVRAHLARAAQQMGLTDELGSRLDDAVAASAKLLDYQISAALPERSAELQRLAELDDLAKRRFLDGDVRGAEEAYLSAEDLRDDHERHGPLGAHVAFLGWLLEAGNLLESVRFVQATDWVHPLTQVTMARRVADELGKAGRRSAGLDLLRSLRPVPDVADAHVTLCWLGQALWAYGETQEGVATVREAARASIARAAQDVQVPLWGYSHSEPIALAQLQCAIGDREGAVVTLDGVMELAAPAEYDPPPPRPADVPASTLFISGGPRLKPASGRWLSSLPDLIRVLARAGLDDVALSLATSAATGQLKLLGEVARGQARRGAYSEAFRTVERMERTELTEANEPSQVFLKPDGTVTVFTQTCPTRPVEAAERASAVGRSLELIRGYAAEAGDTEVFWAADRLLRQPSKPGLHAPTDFLHLTLLVRQGRAGQALAAASSMPVPRERLFALRHVIECVVKAAKPTRDDVLASSYR